MPDPSRPADDVVLLHKRVAREREARRQAESLLEQKSLELYQANADLRASQEVLEARVAERTAELAHAIARLRREAADRTLLHRAATLATVGESVESGLQQALTLVCEHIGWPIGHAYLRSTEDPDELVPSGIWHAPDEDRYHALREVTARSPFRRGVGLPGVVLETGEPEWIVDVQSHPNFPRARLVLDLGVRTAVGFPVRMGGQTVAVLEFFADESLEPDEHLLTLMRTVGMQLGQVIERRQFEQALAAAKDDAETANRAKSDFLANMSHEIRTPMTAILGFADLLAESVSAPQALEAVGIVRRNGELLLSIINGILDLSKIESGRLELERVEVATTALIAEVHSLMLVGAEAKALQLNVEFAGPVPEVVIGDPTRIKQILLNLIGNAIKFTEVGSVRLIVEFLDAPQPMLQFDVVDTGIGMTAAEAERLFVPFSQADSSTTRRFGGTGLGLTICHRLAQVMGGEVVLVESARNVGTRFRATVAARVPPGVRLVAGDMVARQDTKPVVQDTDVRLEGRVLLVEDGRDNQRLIGHILRRAGAVVTIAENGRLGVEAALEAWTGEEPFDVILTDMQMPVMDGYEAARFLRSRGYPGPIVALTANAMSSDRERCLAAGCDDYATKPVDRRRLLETIRGQIARARV